MILDNTVIEQLNTTSVPNRKMKTLKIRKLRNQPIMNELHKTKFNQLNLTPHISKFHNSFWDKGKGTNSFFFGPSN